jgi:hypothetical protein
VTARGRLLDRAFALLKAKGLRQTWLARRLGRCRAAVSAWHRGRNAPSDPRTLSGIEEAILHMEGLPDPVPPPPRRVVTETVRFWDRVRTGPGCWEWEGASTPAGHGHLRRDGRSVYAHRKMLEIMGVAVPRGRWVVHACGNPRCVRPDHLDVCTPGQAIRRYRRPAKARRPRKGAAPGGAGGA